MDTQPEPQGRQVTIHDKYIPEVGEFGTWGNNLVAYEVASIDGELVYFNTDVPGVMLEDGVRCPEALALVDLRAPTPVSRVKWVTFPYEWLPKEASEYEAPEFEIEKMFDEAVKEMNTNFDRQEELKEELDNIYPEDVVVDPIHYSQFPIQPITFITANNLDFTQGSVVKYACRAGSKPYPNMTVAESAVRDWEKVADFANKRIKAIQTGSPL